MEVAATVILAAGIPAVLAKSFSRTFFRNAINNGLVPVECDTSAIAELDELAITVHGSVLDARDLSTGRSLAGALLPPMMTAILDAGGIVEFMRHGGWGQPAR